MTNVQQSVGGAKISTERLIALELRREVAVRAETLAQWALEVFDKVGNTYLQNSQINGLLSIANTTDRVADVARFLERQASRNKDWEQYAERLLRLIRKDLKDQASDVAKVVANQVGDYHKRISEEDKLALTALKDPSKRLPEIHLSLVRELIQSFAAYYLYSKRREQSKRGGN